MLKISMKALAIYALLISPSFAQSVEEIDRQAEAAQSRGNIDKAMKLYLTLAKREVPFAMNALAALYGEYKNNDEKALMWCTVAANFGHAKDFGCIIHYTEQLSPERVKWVNQLATQCIATRYKACDVLSTKWKASVNKYLSTQCTANNPSAIKMDIRSAPNRQVIDQRSNGQEVVILDRTKDVHGQEWAYVRSSSENQLNLGWVLKSHLTCQA